MMRNGGSALAAAAALVLLVAAPAGAQAKREAMRIGVLTDVSGGFADVAGAGSKIAAELAVEDFGGRAAGVPVEIVLADHQNKADVGLAIARRWFDVDKVDAITDVPNSAIALAVSDLAKSANKVLMVTAAVSSRLTGDLCSPNTIHYSIDTWTMSNVPSAALVRDGGSTWYYVTADYAFGHDLERQSMEAAQKAGAQVLGSVRHPLNAPDFSSFLLQAQSSKAKVIALANSQADFINAVKQAHEFQIEKGGQKIVGLAVYVSDIAALGLDVAQGTLIADAWYWDLDEETRSFAKRFTAKNNGKAPTGLHANVYSSVTHYLKAADALKGADDGKAIVAKMKELPGDDKIFGKSSIRADGRRIAPIYMFQVKTPAESKYPYDYYKIVQKVPVDEAFRPLAAGNCPLVK
jgi:branched-chain amino acid transport system substrate-binding protein